MKAAPIQKNRRSYRFVIFAVVGASAISVPLFFLSPFFKQNASTASTQRSLLAHKTALNEHAEAVLLPGSGNNTARQNMNAILQTILVADISDEERGRKADEGLRYIREMERQVGSIRTYEKALARTTDTLSMIARERSGASSRIDDIVTETQSYMDDASRTSEILSSMNEDTRAILETIIENDGALTEEHIGSLNDDIPEAEKNFDELSFLYRDMTQEKQEIVRACDELLSD